jgi:archaeosine-15-forming tRNA-guanine transglycosylase
VVVIFLSYQWPRTAIFKEVVNTEVKRIGTRDQYRITAIKQANNKRMVFRNEDAWYRLKFNSADIQGDAAHAARERLPVKITYYGWRSNLFSWFWNVTKVKVLQEKEETPTKSQ